ncbi:hypothetical protein fugu_010737 [Takifugu bimaculatus]|uniref:Upstream stimulatory factor 1 n=1 Tax=Takifugu bimaculatus TaxID=433685 RepID=A0A4Z2CAX0_9TELE|nr:hypothetical protein fugu_010737 [Takifugu bimaculatus]
MLGCVLADGRAGGRRRRRGPVRLLPRHHRRGHLGNHGDHRAGLRHAAGPDHAHRAGVCDDVAPGGFNGLQPEVDRPPHAAVHREAGGSSRFPGREEASAAQRGSAAPRRRSLPGVARVNPCFFDPTVERRRRDKINNWIVQLSKTIPDCNIDYTKTGQVSPDRWAGPGLHRPSCHPGLSLFQSKGGILSKACEYIKELRQSNLKLGEDVGALDRVRIDNQLLRQEIEDWKSKNQILRNLLRQHGIVGSSSTEPQ